MLNQINVTITASRDKEWIAFARDERGNLLSHVTLNEQRILNRPAIVLDGYWVSPDLSSDAAQAVGDELDSHIAAFAARQGIGSFLLIIPHELRESYGAIYERKVFEGTGGIALSFPMVDGVNLSPAIKSERLVN